jgi:hypothetical protein
MIYKIFVSHTKTDKLLESIVYHKEGHSTVSESLLSRHLLYPIVVAILAVALSDTAYDGLSDDDLGRGRALRHFSRSDIPNFLPFVW